MYYRMEYPNLEKVLIFYNILKEPLLVRKQAIPKKSPDPQLLGAGSTKVWQALRTGRFDSNFSHILKSNSKVELLY